MDYGKFLFDKKKRFTAGKKKQRQMQVKEIKFRPTTDIGDYTVKLKKIITFLERGDKVKVSLRFRGREMCLVAILHCYFIPSSNHFRWGKVKK